jgi:carbamoyl-phosphate synthase large subunit
MTEKQAGTLKGVIVQFGGQTPLKLAEALEANDIPLLGTKRDALDRAEDRERFKALVEKLGLKQPNNAIARNAKEAKEASAVVGYPSFFAPQMFSADAVWRLSIMMQSLTAIFPRP